MAGEWTDWADGNDLAGMSRSSDVLGGMGYDPDEVRASPNLRAEVMDKVSNPYAPEQQPQQEARNARPPDPAPQRQRQAAAPQPSQQAPPPSMAEAARGGDTTAGAADAGANADPRMAVPAGEPPRPVLRTRPNMVTEAERAMAGGARLIPDTLAQAAAGPAPAATQAAPGSPNPAAPAWQQTDARQAVEGELNAANTVRDLYNGDPNPPDTTALDTRIEAESIPTNPRATDPVTGKPLYKTGFWGEVGRALNDARLGAAGLSKQITPYGAPNRAYAEDEQHRQDLLLNDQTKKANLLARFKTLTDAQNARAQHLQSVAPVYEHAATGATAAQNAQTDAEKAAAAAQANSPAGKTAVTQAQFDQRDKEADRIFGPKKGGEMRTLYLANGKIPDPRQPTGEEIARSQALRVFKQQYHRDPQTLDEINQINMAAAGRTGEGGDDDKIGSVVAAATGKKNEFLAQYDRQPDGSYLKKGANRFSKAKGDRLTGPEFDAQVEQYRLGANRDLAGMGAEIDAQGNVRRRGQQPRGAPTAQAAPVAAPEGASAEVYDPNGNLAGHMVNGQVVWLPGKAPKR